VLDLYLPALPCPDRCATLARSGHLPAACPELLLPGLENRQSLGNPVDALLHLQTGELRALTGRLPDLLTLPHHRSAALSSAPRRLLRRAYG
jgi:hypothetical protein